MVSLLIVFWRYWQHRRREQAAALQALQDKYAQQLQLALERLKQKVNLTREMELQRLRGDEPEFPKWLQTYRDEQLTLSKESLDELIASVDTALDGAISRLRKEVVIQITDLNFLGKDCSCACCKREEKSKKFLFHTIVLLGVNIFVLHAKLRAKVLKFSNI